MSKDDGRPNWRFTAPSGTNVANVRIKLVEDDGGLEKKDDFVDINPKANKKDLYLKFNQRTGRVSGDASGRRGQTIRSRGKYDSGQSEIWFTIR